MSSALTVDGVNTSINSRPSTLIPACPHFLSLEPDINLNSPNKGLGPTGGVDSLTGVSMEGGATGVAAVNTLPPGLTEEEAEELYSELGKVGPVVLSVGVKVRGSHGRSSRQHAAPRAHGGGSGAPHSTSHARVLCLHPSVSVVLSVGLSSPM